MGFWDSLGNTLGDITGVNQADRARQQNEAGKINQGLGSETMGQAAGTAGRIASVDPSQFAAGAGAAGSALGDQMGRTAGTAATQQTAQAARTAGVNKGQAAMLGGQAAGGAYTQGQQAGQGLGMGAYGEGAQNQTNAASVQGTIGANQGALGTSQQTGALNQSEQGNKATGSLLSAAGGMFGLSKGGIATQPTVVGEKGPEVVLPLNDPGRIAEILKKIGLDKGAEEVEGKMNACPACGQPMKAEKKETANAKS